MKTRIIAAFASLLACLPMTSAWANSTTYYANLTTKISSSSPTGAGTVYAGDTAGSDNAVGSADSTSSPATVKIKANAQWNDENFEFLGWSDTDGGDIVSTANPYEVAISSGNSTSPGEGKKVFANFKSRSVPGYTLNFLPTTNGSYTQNGQDPAGETEEMTKPYSATLVAVPDAGYRVLGWYKIENGVKSYFNYASAKVGQTFAAKADIGVDFIEECNYAIAKTDSVAGFTTLQEAMTAAASGETVLAFADAEIAEGAKMTVPAGVTLNLTEGVKLAAYGKLDIKGQVVGEGKIVKNSMIVSQEAEIKNPYGSIKYQVTKAESAAESVSGTPSCGIAYAVTVKRGGVVIARSAPSAFQPKAMVCTVDPEESLNHIVSCDSVHDTFPAAVNAHSSRNADQNPAKIVVMLADGTVALADVPDLEQIKSGKRQGKVSCGFRVDCAGFSPTVSFTSTNGSKEYYINAKTAKHSNDTNNSTDYYINCDSVSAKLNVNNSGYSSRAEIYDCGTVSCSYSGSNDIVANKGGFYFFSGGPYSNAFGKNVRAYGGTFTHDPSDYLANPDLYVVELEAGKLWLVTDEKPVVQAFEIGGKTYVTLADAIANAANGARIAMLENYELTGDIVIPAGKTVEIDLAGLKITGSGKVTNNGTFIVGDGSNYATGKGTFEPAIVNNGALSLCYGNYTGAIALNAGSSIVTRAGTFKGGIAVNEGAAVDFRGGKFASSMAAYLADGYRERLSGGLYCVGEIFEADVKDATQSGSERAYRLSAINFADAADYQLSEVRGDKDYAYDEDGALWYRHAELKSAIDPYSGWVVDCAVSFDHAVVADSVNFSYVMSKTLDKDLTAGEVYRCMSPIIASFGYTQISYGRFVAGDPATSVTVGLNNVAGHDENLGTVCTIEMRIYESSKNDDVYLTLARRRVTLGAYDNKAMIRGADGAVTFYPTLADAVAAVAKGGVIELAADCDENVTVNTSCTINVNGFAFGGTVAAREGWGTVSENEGVWTVEIADPAARVDETEFKTVAEALADCAEGAEIVLLRDCAEELKDVAKVCSFKMNGFTFVENGGVTVEVGYKIAYDKAKATWFVTLAEVQVEPPKAEEIKPEVTEKTEVRDGNGDKVEVTPEVKEAAEKAVEKAAEETVAEVKAILTTTEVIDLKETGIEAAVKASKTQVKESVIEVLKQAVVEKAKTDAKVEEKAEEVQKALANQEVEVSGFVNVKLTETEMKVTKTEEATVAKVVSMRFDVTPKVQIKVNDVAVEAVVPPEEITEKIRFRLPLTVAFSVSAKVVHHAATGDVDMGLYPVRNEDGVQFVEVESDSFSPYDVIQDGAKVMVGEQAFDDLAAAIAAAGGDLTKIVVYDGTLEAPADYRLVENEDGTWSVVAKRYVAQVGDEKFEKLSEAVTAASRNGTVEILDSIELEETVVVDKNLTFVLGGKTVTVADGKGGIRTIAGAILVASESGIDGRIVTASASATDSNGKAIFFGSLDDVAAYLQKLRREGDASLDNVTIQVADGHADYPKAFFEIDGPESISRNITDVSYTFYAYDRKVRAQVGASDWDICNDLIENPTAAQIARRDEIAAQIEPFKNFGWHADFEVTFDKPVAAGSVSLSGYYTSWLDGTVLTYDLDKDLDANQRYRLLKDKAGILYSYREILEQVKMFGCGVKNKSAANAGVKMTVELRLYYGTSGHVEGAEVPSLLMGSYEYVLKGPEIVMSIDDEVKAMLTAAGLDEETRKRYEDKIVANEAVNGYKQTGVEDSLSAAEVEAGAYGYFSAVLTNAVPNEAGVLAEMAFDVTARKVVNGADGELDVTTPVMMRLPVDASTSLTNVKVCCDGALLGYYPVRAVTLSTQQPLEDPTKKPEGKENVPWEELSPVGKTIYTFVEFPASAFPAAYSYQLIDPATDYTITYLRGNLAEDVDVVLPTEPSTYRESNKAVHLDKATCDKSSGMTFAGWKINGGNAVVDRISAGTSGNLTLTATWQELATTVEILVKTNGEESTEASLPIKVTKEWATNSDNVDQAALEAAETEEAKAKVIKDALNTKDENGNLKWQNYVIGIVDPTAQVEGGAQQNAEEKTVKVVPENVVAPTADTGFKVSYSLDEVKTNGEVVTEGAATTSDNLNVDLDSVDSNAFFKVNVIITKDDGTGEPTKIAAENTLGVLKVNEAPATSIVGVPWKDIGGADVTVDKLVKTATLTPGDKLYVYEADGKSYTTWNLDALGEWRTTGEGGEKAGETSVPRGSAVWLKRQDSTKPIVLFGQAETEKVETTIEQAATETEKSWNIVAAPTVEPIDLNEKFNKDTKTDVEKDQIIVPTDGAPKNYTFENGTWGYTEAVTVEDPNTGKKRVKATRVTTDTKVPACTGFWYLNGGQKVDVQW